MSLNKSNSDEDGKSKSFDQNKNNSENFNPELITAYIDNETSIEENKIIENYISSDHKIKLRYDFEKITTEEFKNRVKRIETPQYLYKNIYDGIDEYCKTINSKNEKPQYRTPPVDNLDAHRNQGHSIPQKYIYVLGGVFIILVTFFIIFNFYPGRDFKADNNIVAISRNIFDKLEAGNVKMEYETSNAAALENYLENKSGFDVFVPDVKGAVLMGGVLNEFHGQKIIHFVHKKNNMMISTLQANRSELFKEDKLFLPENHKDDILEGKNWFPCMKIREENTIIWHRDNIICISVSKIETNEICETLTNCK